MPPGGFRTTGGGTPWVEKKPKCGLFLQPFTKPRLMAELSEISRLARPSYSTPLARSCVYSESSMAADFRVFMVLANLVADLIFVVCISFSWIKTLTKPKFTTWFKCAPGFASRIVPVLWKVFLFKTLWIVCMQKNNTLGKSVIFFMGIIYLLYIFRGLNIFICYRGDEVRNCLSLIYNYYINC
ncbi:hypothetical protein ABM34_10730 [Companilactobacillus ginsenosidimutans]|uniref:Uncharacterized protein n=1 Tax=Companilactobacillus ginsenosidimutans TaxID=1007676 RepID=A0A0H4QJ62_9LACO|nr:hypothetical protein ABM34_10730 [Companilactobacillus ginsenosidimutans]